jgi:hypothetical protein
MQSFLLYQNLFHQCNSQPKSPHIAAFNPDANIAEVLPSARHQWLVPVILAAWVAEIGRIHSHESKSWQIVPKTPTPK